MLPGQYNQVILVKAIAQLIPNGDAWRLEPKVCGKVVDLIKEMLSGLDVNTTTYYSFSLAGLLHPSSFEKKNTVCSFFFFVSLNQRWYTHLIHACANLKSDYACQT